MLFTRRNKKGITFIELLIVTAILGVVSLAIYAVFNNGLKVWEKINKPLAEEDINIFFEKWAGDLRNCLKSSGIVFAGDGNRLAVPTLVNSAGLNKKTIGSAVYSYDEQAKVLNRQERDISQIYNKEEGRPAQVLKNIGFLKFDYYYYDAEKKAYLWKDECSSSLMPLAVRVELGYDDQSKNGKFTKIVNIPISA